MKNNQSKLLEIELWFGRHQDGNCSLEWRICGKQQIFPRAKHNPIRLIHSIHNTQETRPTLNEQQKQKNQKKMCKSCLIHFRFSCSTSKERQARIRDLFNFA